MEQAVQDERTRRDAAAADTNRKHTIPSAEVEQVDPKRAKLNHLSDPSASSTAGAESLSGFLANFDFSALPVGLVADLVIANLQLLPEQTLTSAIDVKSCDLWHHLILICFKTDLSPQSAQISWSNCAPGCFCNIHECSRSTDQARARRPVANGHRRGRYRIRARPTQRPVRGTPPILF